MRRPGEALPVTTESSGGMETVGLTSGAAGI